MSTVLFSLLFQAAAIRPYMSIPDPLAAAKTVVDVGHFFLKTARATL